MRFEYGYQPFHEFLPLINLLYPILEGNFEVAPENMNIIEHYGNFSEYQHISTPDEFYHAYVVFEDRSFKDGDPYKYYGFPREKVGEFIPLELEDGAELIEALGWGSYSMKIKG